MFSTINQEKNILNFISMHHEGKEIVSSVKDVF